MLSECRIEQVTDVYEKVVARKLFQMTLKSSRFDSDLKLFMNQVIQSTSSEASEEEKNASEAAVNKKDLLCLAVQSPQELINHLLDEAVNNSGGKKSVADVILDILTILEKIVLRKTDGKFHLIHEIVTRQERTDKKMWLDLKIVLFFSRRYVMYTNPDLLCSLSSFVANLTDRLTPHASDLKKELAVILVELCLKHTDKPEVLRVLPNIISRETFAGLLKTHGLFCYAFFELVFIFSSDSSERDLLLILRSLIHLTQKTRSGYPDDQELLINLMQVLVADNSGAKTFVARYLREKSFDWFFRPRSEAVTLVQVVNSSKDDLQEDEEEDEFRFPERSSQEEQILLIHLAARDILPGK